MPAHCHTVVDVSHNLVMGAGQDEDIANVASHVILLMSPSLLLYAYCECIKRYLMAQVTSAIYGISNRCVY